MRRCTKCGESKPHNEFHRHKRSSDGRQAHCKTCRKAHRTANRDAIAEKQRAYHAENQEAERRRVHAYGKTNPHKSWERHYRQRVRRFGFEPVVESFTRDELIARYGDQCWHCGGNFDELDHHPVPVSRGGPHRIDNCRPSCGPCNHDSWNQAVA